jgi:hypothetical protein
MCIKCSSHRKVGSKVVILKLHDKTMYLFIIYPLRKADYIRHVTDDFIHGVNQFMKTF